LVMVTTPCLAEIEPDGSFSLHGTQWSIFEFLIFPFWLELSESSIGFYGGKGYPYLKSRAEKSFYVYMLAVSIFMYDNRQSIVYGIRIGEIVFGIVQPIGIGMAISLSPTAIPLIPFISIWLLTKTDDNWIPTETIAGIAPSQGEQGTTLTDVFLFGVNTTFQDNPPVEVNFDPPDGLTVSNINVASNTMIVFDLEIAVDAPVGYKDVIVVYDDGKKSIERDKAFRVTEKTN